MNLSALDRLRARWAYHSYQVPRWLRRQVGCRLLRRHRVKWNGGNAWCIHCLKPAREVR